MSKYLFSITVSLFADGGDEVQSVGASYVIRDNADTTYFHNGSFTVTSLIPVYHEAIRRIVEEVQDQICTREGLSCSSSSSPSSSL